MKKALENDNTFKGDLSKAAEKSFIIRDNLETL